MRIQSSFHVLSVLALGLQLQACHQPGDTALSSSSPLPDSKTCSLNVNPTDYFEDANSVADLPTPSDEDAIRERIVKIKIKELKKDILAGAAHLRLELFRDHPVDVTVERIQKNPDDQIVLTGRLKDEPLSSVVMALQGDVVSASVNPVDQQHYKISYRGSGIHSIQEVVNREDENESSCASDDTLRAEDASAEVGAEGEEAMATAPTAKPVIDMLVAYTPAARSSAGGEKSIKALIATGIANTNKAFADSGVNLSVRLVGTLPLRQNESSNFSRDLSNLRSRQDGKWDEVHAARARLGADQVTVVGNYPGNRVAGIGFIKASSASAFTIVKKSAFSMHTFAHELGHNIGLRHSDGYVNRVGRFRTIMAYGSYPRIIRFSNPGLTYRAFATGTRSNNSSSILRVNGPKTARLLASKTQTTAADIPIQADSQSNCVP